MPRITKKQTEEVQGLLNNKKSASWIRKNKPELIPALDKLQAETAGGSGSTGIGRVSFNKTDL